MVIGKVTFTFEASEVTAEVGFNRGLMIIVLNFLFGPCFCRFDWTFVLTWRCLLFLASEVAEARFIFGSAVGQIRFFMDDCLQIELV